MAENKRRVSEETEGQYDVKHFKSTGSKLYPVDLIKTEMDMDKVDDENLCTVANGGHVIIMECVACQRAVEVNSQNVLLHQIFGEHSLKPRHQMLSLICFSDGTKPHVVAVQVKKCWWTIEEILTSCDTVERDGILEVSTFGERIVLSVLNSIVYRSIQQEHSDNPTFDSHPPDETAKIMWQKGKAVGFYSIKNKGKLINLYSGEVWGLNILDTIFVRTSHCHKGLATKMLENFLDSYPKGDVGLSFPIEKPMLKICHRVLMQRTKDRERLWECQESGCPSQRRNIWLGVKQQTLSNEQDH